MLPLQPDRAGPVRDRLRDERLPGRVLTPLEIETSKQGRGVGSDLGEILGLVGL